MELTREQRILQKLYCFREARKLSNITLPVGFLGSAARPINGGGFTYIATSINRAWDQVMGIPGGMGLINSAMTRFSGVDPPARIMPSLTPKRVLRGFKLATTRSVLPTSSSGL